jgi:hypothetical protein
MNFPFHYEPPVRDGFTLPGIDGHLVIESTGEPQPDSDVPDWVVTEIHVEAFERRPDGRVDRAPVLLPESHWLWERLLLDILRKHTREIDELWHAEMRDAIAAAQRRFRPAARPVLIRCNDEI